MEGHDFFVALTAHDVVSHVLFRRWRNRLFAIFERDSSEADSISAAEDLRFEGHRP